MRWALACLLCTVVGCDRLLGLANVPAPAPVDAPPDALPPGNWSTVAAGYLHTCAIEASDASLWCWGRNEAGEVGIGGGSAEVDGPARVDGSAWIAISGSALSSTLCGIHADQTLWCWGGNDYRQVGPGSLANPTLAPVQVPGAWTAVSAGHEHTCALQADHSLWCWGSNAFGQLGSDPVGWTGSSTPLRVIGTWKSLAVGEGSTCAISMDDTLWCFGHNVYGELGDGSTASRFVPVPIDALSTYSHIALGVYFACGVRMDGHVRCWGFNNIGQLADSTTTDHHLPEPVGDDDADWADIAAGAATVCATRTDGTLWCWGDNRHGQLASGHALALASAPRKVDVGFVNFTGISVGEFHTCAVSADHNLWCAGGDSYGQLGDAVSHRTPIQVAGHWHAPVAGDSETCALDDAGALWCWGDNSRAEIGDGTSSPRAEPVMIGGSLHESVSVGAYAVSELRNGTLWCWGENDVGTFGDGTSAGSIVPEPVTMPKTWTQVLLAQSSVAAPVGPHACAIDDVQGVYCWGDNSVFQVSSGATPVFSTPQAVLSNATALGVGNAHSCALQVTKVECWGRNDHGQLGDGSTADRGSPIPIMLPIMPVALAVGGSSSCALDASGAAACWGNDLNGQLGEGAPRDVPTPVLIANTWRALALGDRHACGVATDHTLWCWGDDARGQLGDGGQAPLIQQTQIGSDTDWDKVTSALTHSCATKLDGRLFCWGDNTFGQLGDGHGWRTTLAIVSPP